MSENQPLANTKLINSQKSQVYEVTQYRYLRIHTPHGLLWLVGRDGEVMDDQAFLGFYKVTTKNWQELIIPVHSQVLQETYEQSGMFLKISKTALSVLR